MSLESNLITLAQNIGADIKLINNAIGNRSTLSTAAKTSLVAAVNELKAALDALSTSSVGINDTAGSGVTTVTWSANKIYNELIVARQAVKAEILGGASAALDTLNELAAALGNDANFAASIAAELTNRVRVDQAQTFTNAQKTQARVNIEAASSTTLDNLILDLGNVNADFVAEYETAKTV